MIWVGMGGYPGCNRLERLFRPVGFFAAGSATDIFACLDSHALIVWTIRPVSVLSLPCLAMNDVDVCLIAICGPPFFFLFFP